MEDEQCRWCSDEAECQMACTGLPLCSNCAYEHWYGCLECQEDD